MNRCWRPILLLLALVLGMPAAALALDLTDDRGTTVRLDRPPQRIVSLLPSLTETVCGLGACRRLVGVDRYSNHPEEVRRLPQLGGGIDPSVEAVLALRPDVVLIATSAPAAERLEALGLKVLALEPRTLADVQRVTGVLAQLLEVAQPQRLWQAMEAEVAAAARSLPPGARHTRVYFEVGAGPYAAGTSSFMGELLQRLGVQNIIGPELGPFPKINPEFVVRADPDVIMIGERNAQGLGQRPGWAGLRALREGRTCVFGEAESDVLVRPGPRMGEAARLLARCIAAKGRT
jgi:iron complex transport system substrate-binding protein